MKSVSRNFPKTIASELVEVKPMGAPSSIIWHLNYSYKVSHGKPKTITLRGSELKPIKL